MGLLDITGFALFDTLSVDTVVANIQGYVPRIVACVVLLLVGYLLIRMLRSILIRVFKKTKWDPTVEIFLTKTIVGIAWMVLVLVLLSNLGVDVSGIIAGLGIMGFVLGFALKDTLGNLAAGLFILAYRPFKVGHWVDVGGVSGSVIEMGLAATELKSADGVKITVPNSSIWGSPIQNYSGNTTRCIRNLSVGIGYDDDIGKATKVVHALMKKDARILTDPAPSVVVTELGDSAVTLSIRPHTKTEDFWDVYFDLIVKVKQEFDKKGISIPYPQQDVHVRDYSRARKR